MATERPKPAEPISPSERGTIVGQFIDWTYDTLLALPEAVSALKTDCRGPRFAVSPSPEAGKLTFLRNDYRVSLVSSPVGNLQTGTRAFYRAKQGMRVEISPIDEAVADPDKFLTVYATTTHIGDPETDSVALYEDGELHTYVLTGDSFKLDNKNHDSSVVARTEEKIMALLGIKADEPAEFDEDIDGRLGFLS